MDKSYNNFNIKDTVKESLYNESLPLDQVLDIKSMVSEKRFDYALAPIGSKIFTFITNQSGYIQFGALNMKPDDVYGMSYLHKSTGKYTYVILNSNKPLREQIFTAACEYYVYLKGNQRKENKFYIIRRNKSNNDMAKCSRYFATELLLPTLALSKEIELYRKSNKIPIDENLSVNDLIILISSIVIKYQIPTRGVIYKLINDGYISTDIINIMLTTAMERRIEQHINICERYTNDKDTDMNGRNIFLSSIYFKMERSFLLGNATEKDIIEDAESIGLDLEYLEDFFAHERNKIEDEEDEDEDEGEEVNEYSNYISELKSIEWGGTT